MSIGEAARGSWRFWLLAVVFLFGGVTIKGTLAHVVALLIDRGMTPLAAASYLAMSGMAAVLARLLGGWCLDRPQAPFVASFFMLLAAGGVLLLWSEAGGAAPLTGVICLWLGLGVEIDAMGFLISRYFGLKAFGQIYGWPFPAFTLGVGIGPALMGATFDRARSYDPMLLVFFFLLLVTVVLLAILGPYAYPKPRATPVGRAAAAE